MKYIDELRKLKRDLMGLRGLLYDMSIYDMSTAAEYGGSLDEAEPMLLAEIAGRSAETVEHIIKEAENHVNVNT